MYSDIDYYLIVKFSGSKKVNVEFFPEATEMLYPCESAAAEEWDEAHPGEHKDIQGWLC